MKRNMAVKCLLFAIVAFAALFCQADVVHMPRITYKTLSYFEWLYRHSDIEEVIDYVRSCSVEGLIVLLCCVWLSLAVAMYVMSWLLTRFSTRFSRTKAFLTRTKAFLIGFGFFSTLLIVGFVFTSLMPSVRSMVMAKDVYPSFECDITVEPKDGESYEEYCKRVDGLNYESHKTPRCDLCRAELEGYRRRLGRCERCESKDWSKFK